VFRWTTFGVAFYHFFVFSIQKRGAILAFFIGHFGKNGFLSADERERGNSLARVNLLLVRLKRSVAIAVPLVRPILAAFCRNRPKLVVVVFHVFYE
jgi:hypothetical protein